MIQLVIHEFVIKPMFHY